MDITLPDLTRPSSSSSLFRLDKLPTVNEPGNDVATRFHVSPLQSFIGPPFTLPNLNEDAPATDRMLGLLERGMAPTTSRLADAAIPRHESKVTQAVFETGSEESSGTLEAKEPQEAATTTDLWRQMAEAGPNRVFQPLRSWKDVDTTPTKPKHLSESSLFAFYALDTTFESPLSLPKLQTPSPDAHLPFRNGLVPVEVGAELVAMPGPGWEGQQSVFRQALERLTHGTSSETAVHYDTFPRP